ncbi:MAG: UDP-glucuronic acid decarboxylase family protein [Pseudomonadota bacterium]
MKKTCLVTGGAGFLGSHVCTRLLAEGHRVVAIDSLQTGRRENLASLMSNPQFGFVEADVRAPLPDIAFDELWNLACPASPPAYQADPVDTMMVNVLGMKNVLDHAREHGGRVFQASTSEVYGDPEVHPQTEAYRGAVNTIGPRACYDEGKRAAETLCFDYHRQYGTEIKVVRIFNTYGPNMDPADGRVVSNFIMAALKGEPLEIYGGGNQTRSFCYVDDLVDGFFHLMRSGPAVLGPINMGNPGEFTIRELAEIVLEITGSKSELVDSPLPQDDPLQRRPDISLARELFDWSPQVPLRNGLARTIPYFAQYVGHPNAGSPLSKTEAA